MTTRSVRQVTLTLVSLATVFGFSRVFADFSYFVPVAAATIGAHVVAALTRRLRYGLSSVIMFTCGALTTIWTASLGSTTFGVPTGATVDVIARQVRHAGHVVRSGSSPVLAEPGLLLLAVATMWIVAWTADRVTFRFEAPIEALAPNLCVFGVTTLLAGPHHRWSSAAVFAGAISLHLLVGRLSRLIDRTGEHRLASWRPVIPASAMIIIALFGGMILAANVPALHTKGVLAVRSNLRDGPPRSVVSPLVDIRTRLIDQSDDRLFTVRSPRATYWRLMTLDRFDGTIWSSDQQYRSTKGNLPATDPTRRDPSTMTQTSATFDLSGLSGPWAPAPYRATALSGTRDLLWDAQGSTLIVRSSRASVTGLRYRVTSQIPTVTPSQANASRGPIPARIRSQDLSLPAGFPDDLKRLAHDITDASGSPYAKAMALQSYFRDNDHFVYSLDVAGGEGTDAIGSFLRSGVGFCEQFAGTYAALARAVGLPTRIAVGFTPGEQQGDHFTVFGRNAHAWPEVYLGGIGWLPFEPTPGRGNPAAESYTGVRPAQQGPAGVVTAPATTAPTTKPSPTPTSVVANPGHTMPTVATPPATPGATQTPQAAKHRPNLLLASVVVLLATLGAVAGARQLDRRRRNRRARTPAEQIILAWHDTLAAFKPLRFEITSSQTARDIGRRLSARISNLADAESESAVAGHLAALATRAAWQPGNLSEADARLARSWARQLRELAHAHRSIGSRVLTWFDPRSR